MSSTPSFAAVPALGSIAVSSTIETAYIQPLQSVVVFKATGPRGVTDGATNSNTTVTSSTAAFGAGDLGRPISGGTIPAGAVITAVGSATSVTISAAASGTAGSLTLTLGGGVGSQINEIVVEGLGITVLGIIVLSLWEGGTVYDIFDSVAVSVVTPSTSVPPFRSSARYSTLLLPAGWSIVASSWVTNQLAKVSAFGGNF